MTNKVAELAGRINLFYFSLGKKNDFAKKIKRKEREFEEKI